MQRILLMMQSHFWEANRWERIFIMKRNIKTSSVNFWNGLPFVRRNIQVLSITVITTVIKIPVIRDFSLTNVFLLTCWGKEKE